MKKSMIMVAAFAAVSAVSAAPILWDINSPSDVETVDSTVADFTAAGVTQDLTGATVQNVAGSQNMSSGGTTVSLSSGASMYGNNTVLTYNGGTIVQEYLSVRDVDIDATPITVTIGGLATQLDANTDYNLYIWGIGDNSDQEGTFIFNGERKSGAADIHPTTGTTEASVFLNTFTFNTGGTVSDTLAFDWGVGDYVGSREYAGFNGFAIVAVPEPATFGLIGIVGGAMLLIRRRFMI
jgi:hypothetical protein